MSIDGVIRFEPYGPTGQGLAEWYAIDPSGLEAGNPVQHVHIYHEDQAAGYLTGVWDCTPMTIKFGPYEVHEFMFLLEGSITMALADGEKYTIKAGEAFVIPKGLPCQWIQTEYVRKYFMILENPGGPVADDVSSQGVILPKPSGPPGGLQRVIIEDTADFVGEVPKQNNFTYFEDPSRQMTCGVWDSTPYETTVSHSSGNQLLCLLEGSVTLSDAAGREEHFEAGDAVYVSKGTQYGWKSTEYVRTLYSIYAPSGGVETK